MVETKTDVALHSYPHLLSPYSHNDPHPLLSMTINHHLKRIGRRFLDQHPDCVECTSYHHLKGQVDATRLKTSIANKKKKS